MEKRKSKICITGAGGFLASWIVKLFLSKGFIVHGTVRDLRKERIAHLRNLAGASQNLLLFKADLLDYDSLCKAIAGSDGVIHVATPLPSHKIVLPQDELVEVAVNGTLNVLKACKETKVKKVIYVSSVAAVAANPNTPADKVVDEDCWTDEEFCRTAQFFHSWYCISKMVAEKKAFEYGEQEEIDLASICPPYIFGPMLQPTTNDSGMELLKLIKGEDKSEENKLIGIVDVRDVADAILLLYENQDAIGRYISAPYSMRLSNLVEKLKTLRPGYSYHKNFIDVKDLWTKISSEKLMKLGWKPRPLEETLTDAVMCFEKRGLLKD